MKKFQVFLTAAMLVAGLCGAASADSCCSSKAGCCDQKGLRAGWFTGAGTMTAAKGGDCCKADAKAGDCCKADAKAGACCKDKADAKAGCDCSGSKKASCECGGAKAATCKCKS